MFKLLTLAFLGVVTCFTQEDSLELKSAGTSLKAYKDSKKKYESYDKANKAYLKQQGVANTLKAAVGVAQKKYNALKKTSDDLAKLLKKQTTDAGKSKKALAKLVKKDKKMKNKKTKAANTLNAANKKKVKDTTKKLGTAKKATADYKKKTLDVAKGKYTKAAKTLKTLKGKVGNEVTKPKGKTALSIMNKIVLKEKAPLFAEVSVTYKSTHKEFAAFIKTLGHEEAFWKALAKETKSDKKKKVLGAGAKMFLKANKKFAKACSDQDKLVVAKKAKNGKKAFKKATGVYKVELMKSTQALATAMKTYESKKNKKILKGYLKQYKKVEKKQVKLNQKEAAKGGSAMIWIVLGVVGVGIGAFAIWWFKFRKTEE